MQNHWSFSGAGSGPAAAEEVDETQAVRLAVGRGGDVLLRIATRVTRTHCSHWCGLCGCWSAWNRSPPQAAASLLDTEKVPDGCTQRRGRLLAAALGPGVG